MISKKATSTKAILLAFLVLLGMIVSPVLAATNIVTTGYFPDAIAEIEVDNIYDFAYSVNSTRAISNVQFRAPKGTELNYTFTYGAGNSMSGYITYLPGDVDFYGYGEGVTTINIGSATDSRSFVDTGLFRKWEIVGYAREEDDNGTVLSIGYAIYDVSLGIGNIGFQSGFIAYESVVSLQPIESISFTSNKPVWMFIGTSDREEIQAGISRTVLDVVNEWITLALSMGATILGLAQTTFYWLKFIFVDNILITVALYFSVSMAYSAISSKNIFQFYRRFFKDQQAFYKFILGLWQTLINIISSFRGIFRL